MKKLKTAGTPLLAAVIWGTAFVAQKGNRVGSFTFNAGRSFVAVPFLLLLILILNRGDLKHILSEKKKEDTMRLWKGGILIGISLFLATFFQQHGMDLGTEAGKAGFVTAWYMVLVPVTGVFLNKKCGVNVWVSIFLAITGLYFLCIRKGEGTAFFSMRTSDVWVLFCAVFFTAQILLIDHFAPLCDLVKLSCVQFLTCGVLSLAFALIFESISPQALCESVLPILYLGIFSSGIAYTLQMIAQKDGNPAVVSVLMSMESVFSVISGAVILHERLTPREYLGCFIMFLAVIITQLPEKRGLAKKNSF